MANPWPKGRQGPRWFLVVTITCFAGLGLWGFFLFGTHPPGGGSIPTGTGGTPAPTQVTIQGFDFIISYWTSNISDTSYLHSPECGPCPVYLPPSGQWGTSFDLSNSDTGRNHTISNLTVAGPFVVLLVTPTLPLAIAPGQSVSLQVQLQVPQTPGSYFLSGSIGTS